MQGPAFSCAYIFDLFIYIFIVLGTMRFAKRDFAPELVEIVGSRVSLDCTVHSSGPVTITWYVPQGSLLAYPRYFIIRRLARFS